MPARACGTMRTVRMSTSSTTAATTIRPITPAPITTSLVADERRGALDLQDLDTRARLERLLLVVGVRGPHLAADLDRAVVGIDAVEHHRPGADECRRAGARVRGHAQVARRQRADDPERGHR